MSRFKGKPVGGLPGALPEGEVLLWQGAPDWRSLARRAFRIRIVAGYFAALVTWRVAAGWLAGHGAGAALTAGVSSLTLGGVSLGIFAALAWMISRTTTYSVTNKRVVITYGMALPKSLNLPFGRIDAADIAVHADHTGDIAMRLPATTAISYLLLWPHVRAGSGGRAEPVLRCIARPQDVAEMLVDGLSLSAAGMARNAGVAPASTAMASLTAQAA